MVENIAVYKYTKANDVIHCFNSTCHSKMPSINRKFINYHIKTKNILLLSYNEQSNHKMIKTANTRLIKFIIVISAPIKTIVIKIVKLLEYINQRYSSFWRNNSFLSTLINVKISHCRHELFTY